MTFDSHMWTHSSVYKVMPAVWLEDMEDHRKRGYPYFMALNTAAWLEARWTFAMSSEAPRGDKLGALMHRESIPRSRKDPCGSCAACLRRKKDWPDADWQGWELTCSG